jgi:hypothetical protein
MSIDELVVEAKALLGKVEEEIKQVEHADETQLRIAVSRLRLFREHLATRAAFFSDEAQPNGIVEVSSTLTGDEAKELSESFTEEHTGADKQPKAAARPRKAKAKGDE